MSNNRQPRIVYQNAAFADAAALSASSETPDGPVLNLANAARGETWRSKLGWSADLGFNDQFPIEEAGLLRLARVTAGNYATGDDYAAAWTTALNAGTAYVGTMATLSIWLRAYRLRGNFDAAEEGDAVALWDAWGSASPGLDFSQATAGARPTFKATGIAGGVPGAQPYVSFDGTDDELSGPLLSTLCSATQGRFCALIVCRSNAAGGGSQAIVSAGTAFQFLYREASGVFRLTVNDGAAKTVDSAAATQDAWHVVTIMKDATTIYIGVDDTRTASLTSLACGNQTGLGQTVKLGNGSGLNFLLGGIAEVVWFGQEQTETTRKAVEQALANRYGITVASGSPWANTYTATYDGATSKFTIARTAGASSFAIPAANVDGAAYATGGTVEHVWEVCAFDELGFTDLLGVHSGGSSYLADSVAYGSKQRIDVDLGEASCRVAIFDGVNDLLDLEVGGVPGYQFTVPSGIYLTPQSLVDAVNASGVGTYLTFAWNPLTSKVEVSNVWIDVVRLAFGKGPAAVAGQSAHASLGFLTADVDIAVSGSTAGTRQVWGWLPISSTFVLDHNAAAGGEFVFVVNDQPNEGARARGPNSGSWSLRGDETKRLYVREAGIDSPVNYGRRYLRLVVNDCRNADGFAEIGVLWAGPYLGLPPIDPGYTHQPDALDHVSTTEFGAITGEARPQPHRFSGSLVRMAYAARVQLEAVAADRGLVRPFFFLEDPAHRGRVISWTWYMNFASLPSFQHEVAGTASSADPDEPADGYTTALDLVENLP